MDEASGNNPHQPAERQRHAEHRSALRPTAQSDHGQSRSKSVTNRNLLSLKSQPQIFISMKALHQM